MPPVAMTPRAWATLLLGLAMGYTAGQLSVKFEGQINPALLFILWNIALPGIFLIGVFAFLGGLYAIDWLWTRAIWFWLRHKHQSKIRARLLAGAQASEPR